MNGEERRRWTGVHSPATAFPGIWVEYTRHGSKLVVSVTGEVDILTAPRLREALALALQYHPTMLVVDLTGVAFLSSSGLSELIAVNEATTLRLVATTRECLRPIQLASLDTLLSIHPTVDDALNTLD